MNCRNCGTQIADNALICYKCGTATTEPKIAPPAKRRALSPARVIMVIVAVVVLGLVIRMAACGSLL